MVHQANTPPCDMDIPYGLQVSVLAAPLLMARMEFLFGFRRELGSLLLSSNIPAFYCIVLMGRVMLENA